MTKELFIIFWKSSYNWRKKIDKYPVWVNYIKTIYNIIQKWKNKVFWRLTLNPPDLSSLPTAAFPPCWPLSQLPLQDWHRHTLDILPPLAQPSHSPTFLFYFHFSFIHKFFTFSFHISYLRFCFYDEEKMVIRMMTMVIIMLIVMVMVMTIWWWWWWWFILMTDISLLARCCLLSTLANDHWQERRRSTSIPLFFIYFNAKHPTLWIRSKLR